MTDQPSRDLRAPPGKRARLTGIALFCAALFCFACLDAVAKYLNTSMDTLQVVWARYASAFLLAFLFVNPLTRPGLTRTHRLPLQLGRSLLLLACTTLNFLALRYLQLDQTIAINFSTPLFIALLAGPLLGEWIGVRRWAAILVGFTGVLVVTRPGFGGIHWAVFLSVASAMFYATYNIATRLLARTDSSETTLFYSNLVGFVVMTFISRGCGRRRRT